MFYDLPDGCVAHVFRQLHCVQDVCNFARTCKRHANLGQHDQSAWSGLLRKDYDIRLQAPVLEARALYHKLFQSKTCDIRFKGCFTNGGVDNNQFQYWVDNMFRPNHWDSFCSELGQNCSCIGLLLEESDQSDEEQLSLRTYIVKRCKLAAAAMYGDINADQLQPGEAGPDADRTHFLRLQDWPTIRLNHFFLQLFFELQGNTPLGRMLLHGAPAQTLQAEVQQLQMAAGVISHEYNQKLTVVKTPDTEQFLLSQDSIKLIKSPSLPSLLGTVERITISRSGEFSCPVQSGAIFMGNCIMADWASKSDQAMLQHFKETAAQKMSTAFDGVTTLQQLMDAVDEGRLPSPIAAHFAPCGGWVEFHSDAMLPRVTETPVHPKGAQDATDAQTHPLADLSAPEPPLLQPVVWFRMCNAEEFQTHKQLKYVEKDALSLWTLEEGMGQSLPLWFRADSFLTELSQQPPYITKYEPASEHGLETPRSQTWLNVPLHYRHAGNMACVKLIDQENLMEARNDDHEAPNIDINFVAFHGRMIKLK